MPAISEGPNNKMNKSNRKETISSLLLSSLFSQTGFFLHSHKPLHASMGQWSASADSQWGKAHTLLVFRVNQIPQG